MNRRDFLKIVGASSGAAVLAACAPAAQPQQPAKGATPKAAASKPGVLNIRLGHGQPPADITSVLFLPEIREGAGMQHYGSVYEVTPTFILGTNLQVTALAAGEQDLVIVDFMVLPQSIERGVIDDVKVISNVKLDGHPDYRSNVFRVMEDSGIEGPEDLRGETVTTVTIGQSIDYAFRLWLREAGMDPDRDVNIVEMPFASVGPALREGRVAMGPFIPPFDAIEKAAGGMRDVFTLRDVFGPNEQLMHVAFTDWLEEHRDEITAFYEDRNRALQWVLGEGRQTAMQAMSTAYNVPVATYDLFFATNDDDYRHPQGCITPEYLQTPAATVREAGAYEQDIDLTEYIDLSFLPEPCN